VKVRVFTANPRWISATETKVLYVPLELRIGIGLPVRLVIGSAKMLTMPYTVVSRMRCEPVMAPDRTLVTGCEDRASDGSGQNERQPKCFQIRHLVSSRFFR
jgi:hypothetical protein